MKWSNHIATTIHWSNSGIEGSVRKRKALSLLVLLVIVCSSNLYIQSHCLKQTRNSFTKGFSAISSPRVVIGPWPQRTVVVYGKVNNLFLMESIIFCELMMIQITKLYSPPSKSVRPIDRLKSVSPVKRKEPKL